MEIFQIHLKCTITKRRKVIYILIENIMMLRAPHCSDLLIVTFLRNEKVTQSTKLIKTELILSFNQTIFIIGISWLFEFSGTSLTFLNLAVPL